jgi:hypothetical protein
MPALDISMSKVFSFWEIFWASFLMQSFDEISQEILQVY